MSTNSLEPYIEPDQLCRCDNCEWEGQHVDPINDPSARLEAGFEIPAGECPLCGSLAYIVKAEPEPALEAQTTALEAALASNDEDELRKSLRAMYEALDKILAERLNRVPAAEHLPFKEVEIEVNGGIATIKGQVPDGVRVTIRDFDINENKTLTVVEQGAPLAIDASSCRL